MTATLDAPTVHPAWKGPGLYPDLSNEDYHRDVVPGGSLSSSGARKLLAPSCPAKFRYEQDHPQPTKKVFDFGTAAHHCVLGEGPELVLVDEKRWDTDLTKARIAEIRARGAIPLKQPDLDAVNAMADALRRHPLAADLLAPGSGRPEQSLFIQDGPTGVMLRARPDWLPNPGGGRTLIPDYKTCRDASNEAFRKDIEKLGYHQQAPFYIDVAVALGLVSPDAEFLFVAQEKTPPFLVNVIGISADWLRIGRAKNRVAIERYAECSATGIWPGYGNEPNYVSQPTWAEIRDTEEYL